MNQQSIIHFFQYGIRHIVEQMAAQDSCLDVLYICGGLSENRLFTQTNADVLGL